MRTTTIYSTLSLAAVLLLTACSRESADWKSATTANTSESYQQFLQQHPNSGNAAAAQTRLTALAEDRDWQAAAAADTRAAYEQFVAQHADSKWVQEARIRIENFAQTAGPATHTASTAPTPDSEVSGLTTTSTMPKAVRATSPPAAASPAVVDVPRNAAVPTRVAESKHLPAPKVASAAPTVTPPLSATTHGSYVQLGAFSSRERAQAEWKTLSAKFPAELKSLKPDYVQGSSGQGTVYRLRVPMSSVATAKGLCEELKKRSQLCIAATA
jgi:hypothetical protein